MGIVNHLATTMEQASKKIEKQENQRQFHVNHFDNVEGHDETFLVVWRKRHPLHMWSHYMLLLKLKITQLHR